MPLSRNAAKYSSRPRLRSQDSSSIDRALLHLLA
jgi:hypothetical protein